MFSIDQLKALTEIPLAVASIGLVVYVLKFLQATNRENLRAMNERDCRYELILDKLNTTIANNTEVTKTLVDRMDEISIQLTRNKALPGRAKVSTA